MTLPAQNIQLPTPDAPTRTRRVKGEYTLLDNDLIGTLLRTADGKTRVLLALGQQSNYTRKRGLTHAELMLKTGLSASAVEKALRQLREEGRCEVRDSIYAYARPTGPRLPAPTDKRGRYDRQEARAKRKEQTAQAHTCTDNRPDTLPYNYTVSAPKNDVQHGEFSPTKEVEGSLYISTTTSTDTRAEGSLVEQGAEALAEASVVVVGSASQDSEQHPPVGGAADAANTDSAVPVQDFHDQDPEMQEKPATSTENVPPAAAPLAPRTRPELAAASAAHPVPASLNRLLWPDWVTAFAAIEGAGLSGIWTRWQAHVGGNASQQLAQAERWADWVGAGLADALRLQVPETIADTSVRSPARHLAGAMTNRAEEARRAPAPTSAPTGGNASGLSLSDFAAGERIRLAGHEMTIIEVAAKGLVTDHADYAMIPAAYLGQVQRLGGAQ